MNRTNLKTLIIIFGVLISLLFISDIFNKLFFIRSSFYPSPEVSLASSINMQHSYVVAPVGSDNNPGTLDRPFKTVQKCAEIIKPGETCYLRTGIYRETIRPTLSGANTAPITFAAYPGENVTISGTELVGEWTAFRGSIYRANVDLPIDNYSNTGFLANQVFANGEMMPEARWPNSGLDPMRPKLAGPGLKSQGGTTALIENKDIPNLPEGWTDANVWTSEWYVTRTGMIKGGSNGKLLAEMTAPFDRGGWWFYLVGKLGLIDSEGEWFYDGKNQNLYFWAPGGLQPKSVEVKKRNFAFDLNDRSHIVLQNLKLFANTVTTDKLSKGVVLDGINAKYVSHHMTLPPLPKSEQAPGSDDGLIVASHVHDTGIQLRGTGHILKNSIIQWSSGNGILLEGTGHTLINNVISHTNYMASYAAPVRINGDSHKILHNTILSTGRDAIAIDWHTAGMDALSNEIAYNDISGFGMLSTDLGAVYVCCNINLENGSIHHNWIHDAQAFSPWWGTRGIYLDLDTYNSTIHHNVVWNISGGKDSYFIAVGTKKGYHRIFNNSFFGPVYTDSSVEARNNIFAASKDIVALQKSNNLFMDQAPKLHVTNKIPYSLDSDSPAIDSGIFISGITDHYVGKKPDIGAYEWRDTIWRAGSTLDHTTN